MNALGRFVGRVVTRMFGMATPGPLDPFWYGGVGTSTSSGEHISADVGRQVAAIDRGITIIAEGVAKMPCEVFRRLKDDRREEAPDHPLALLIRSGANDTDTFAEVCEHLIGDALYRGRGYAEMIPGEFTFCDQLVPLEFDRVEERRFKGPKKRLTYVVTRADGSKEELGPDRVFRLCGPNGGRSLLSKMRETAGIARASEAYQATQFSQAPAQAGFLSPKAGVVFDPPALKAAAAAFQEANSGRKGWHRAAVLPGVEWVKTGMSLAEAQFLELRKFTREEIAIFLGVPPHKLGVMDKASYASVEAQNRALVDDCLQPWATRLEQAIGKQILAPLSVARKGPPDAYFVKFNFDELLRGTMKERFEAWSVATGNRAWMSPDEVREAEDRDPMGAELAKVHEGLGNTQVGRGAPGRPEPRRPEPEDDEEPEPKALAEPAPDLGRLVPLLAAVREYEAARPAEPVPPPPPPPAPKRVTFERDAAGAVIGATVTPAPVSA